MTAVIRIEPSAPIDAASDGAAMPAMIEPSTAPTSPTGGATTLTSLRGELGARNQRALFGRDRRHIMRAHNAENENVDAVDAGQHQPGIIAAANSVPTDSFRMSASRIRMRLGGMIWPSVPDAQITPHARPLL